MGFGSAIPLALNTPLALSAVSLLVTAVYIKAQKPSRADNAAKVYLANVSTNDTPGYELIPGESIGFTAPPGCVLDLSKLYVDATTLTDGVTFTYVLPPQV